MLKYHQHYAFSYVKNPLCSWGLNLLYRHGTTVHCEQSLLHFSTRNVHCQFSCIFVTCNDGSKLALLKVSWHQHTWHALPLVSDYYQVCCDHGVLSDPSGLQWAIKNSSKATSLPRICDSTTVCHLLIAVQRQTFELGGQCLTSFRCCAQLSPVSSMNCAW